MEKIMNLYKMIPKVDQILDNELIKILLEENSKKFSYGVNS